MALTVAELKTMLEDFPDDMEVRISYNYGDHWNTQVAPQIEAVEVVVVEYSEYFNMDTVDDSGPELDEETGEPIEGELQRSVLIIRA